MRLPASLAIVFAIAFVAACSQEPIELGMADYKDAAALCASDERRGQRGAHDEEKSDDGIRYSVRTPANYDPAVGHPLLMVYAAAGHNRGASERFTGLTLDATTAGFIVAYADHRRLSKTVLDDLATIPAAIGRKWCVDSTRIFLTGHSDGGTAAAAMAFRPDDGLVPAGIAPSAAGVRGVDLGAYQCPGPLRVMVLHNVDDKLFPGFGADAARWWAACAQCDGAVANAKGHGCMDYAGCARDSRVRYCAGAGGHRRWPGTNAAMLEYFL